MTAVFARLDDLAAFMNTMQTTQTEMNSRIATMQTDISRLETTQTDMVSNMANMATRNADLSYRVGSIQLGMATIQADITSLNTRVQNSSATAGTDSVQPPQRGPYPPEQDFPRSVLTLASLIDDERLRRIEDYYGLSHEGSLETRTKLVKRAYGVGMALI
jgi:TolA-binding protein